MRHDDLNFTRKVCCKKKKVKEWHESEQQNYFDVLPNFICSYDSVYS